MLCIGCELCEIRCPQVFEMVDVYNKSIEINKKINTNKKYCNNFWVGWFYSKEIGELILIDIGRIPSVKSKN